MIFLLSQYAIPKFFNPSALDFIAIFKVLKSFAGIVMSSKLPMKYIRELGL